MEWTGRNGWYESDRGHVVSSIGRRWFITEPDERTPDAEKATLREAKAYVEMLVAWQEQDQPRYPYLASS
jgi:hypothetical protein